MNRTKVTRYYRWNLLPEYALTLPSGFAVSLRRSFFQGLWYVRWISGSEYNSLSPAEAEMLAAAIQGITGASNDGAYESLMQAIGGRPWR